MQELLELARQLVERAQQGPLPDQKRVVANLRFIRERLEKICARHNTRKSDLNDETRRQKMLAGLTLLYNALEELEWGIMRQDSDALSRAGEHMEAALAQLQALGHEIENLEGTAEHTL